MRPLMLALLFALTSAEVAANADEMVSSLVGGYCRIGKYMPVVLKHGGASDVLVEVDAALPVHIRGVMGTTSVVPILTISPPSGIVNIRSDRGSYAHTMPLRVLTESEKLVGLIGNTSAKDVQFLFPNKQIIPVKIDPTLLSCGTLAAWEVLDAIACDLGPIPEDASIRTLLGCGIALAVRSPAPPDDRWPWQPSGDWWALQHDPIGPTTALSESANAPVPGWPPRRSIYAPFMAVGFGLVMAFGALTAWRVPMRFLKIAGVIVAVLALSGGILCGGIYGWSQQLPAQHEAEGTVAYFSGGLLQHDFWEYRSPVRSDGTVSCACFRGTRQVRGKSSRIATRPILASAEQAIRQKLMLEVDALGEPQQWTARLQHGEKLALVTRQVEPWPFPPPLVKRISIYSTNTDSPLQPLVRQAYITLGVRVVGQGYPRTDKKNGFAEVFLERSR